MEEEIADDRKARERPMPFAQRFGAFFCWRWNWNGETSGLSFFAEATKVEKANGWCALRMLLKAWREAERQNGMKQMDKQVYEVRNILAVCC